MKAKNNDFTSEERVCKKCGDPLTSTNKYKYCENCRREKAKSVEKSVEPSLVWE